MTFTNDDAYVSTYDDDSVLINDSTQLFDGQYAYDGDSQLREYHDGRYFIISIHPFELINGSFYHPDDENKPEADTSIEVVTETTQDFTFTRDTETPYILTSSSSVSNSLSSFSSSGSSIVYHPSQFSTPLTLGDIARALGESAQITEITETTQLTETTESPDQHLI